MNDDDAIYFPTFNLRPDLDEGDARWLAMQQGDGPLELADVTDICATFRVSAILRDAQGCVRGWVNARGDYRLQ